MNEKATIEQTEDASDVGKTEQANAIVRTHVYIAGGVGLIPAPGIDLLAQSTVQIDMIARLAKLYGVPFRKDWGKSILTALVGGALPVMFTQPVGSLLKMIPIIGQTVGGLAMSINGAAATYAVGRVFIQHFELGGNMLNFDVDAMKKHVVEHVKEYKAAQGA
jgi:uncharacterized protein (DUF697 family)